ncbi:hypothetical protein D9M72_624460 [compost metagenome]
MLDEEEDLEGVAEYIKEHKVVPVFPAAYRHALATVRKSRTSLTKRGLLPENPGDFTSVIPRQEILS